MIELNDQFEVEHRLRKEKEEKELQEKNLKRLQEHFGLNELEKSLQETTGDKGKPTEMEIEQF